MVEMKHEEVLALVSRSGVIESHHSGHLVMLSADGEVEFSRGNIHQMIYPRSSIKGIQASAMVRAGLDLEPRLLALVAASHSGSPIHQSAVLEILALAGLSESALQNTVDRPLGEAERLDWGNQTPTSLAQNCSGKHAGMLLTCVVNGWSTIDYRSPTHPLQVAIKRELETMGKAEISTISIDGCGAPLFLVSLRAVARAIYRLTTSGDSVHGRVIAACRSHPEMVAGESRSTTRFMRQVSGLFLKEGAEGVGVGSLDDGRTFAFKISDGATRPYAPLVAACLRRFGVLLGEESAPVYGGKEVVGSVTANF
jgi:L-asparaginase II